MKMFADKAEQVIYNCPKTNLRVLAIREAYEYSSTRWYLVDSNNTVLARRRLDDTINPAHWVKEIVSRKVFKLTLDLIDNNKEAKKIEHLLAKWEKRNDALLNKMQDISWCIDTELDR